MLESGPLEGIGCIGMTAGALVADLSMGDGVVWADAGNAQASSARPAAVNRPEKLRFMHNDFFKISSSGLRKQTCYRGDQVFGSSYSQ